MQAPAEYANDPDKIKAVLTRLEDNVNNCTSVT